VTAGDGAFACAGGGGCGFFDCAAAVAKVAIVKVANTSVTIVKVKTEAARLGSRINLRNDIVSL
jgi:hypothetical protein